MNGLPSKLNNGVFNDYMINYDIFCISESKLRRGPEIENYKVFEIENITNDYALPAYHGLHVYIKDFLAINCKQVYNENALCENVLWLNICNKFILGAIYVPGVTSRHWNSEIFDNLSIDIALLRGDYDLPIMLIGDMNSHTNELNDIGLLDPSYESLENTHMNYPNIIDLFKCNNVSIHRKNLDNSKACKNGLSLVKMCKDLDLCILNGRIGNDKDVGLTTYDNKSVIDYALCTPDLFHNIVDFSVDTFDRLYSDKHNPIALKIDIDMLPNKSPQNIRVNSQNTEQHSNKNIKCNWDSSKKDEYNLNIDIEKTNNFLNLLNTLSLNDISQKN